jgi:hypothetical protein
MFGSLILISFCALTDLALNILHILNTERGEHYYREYTEIDKSLRIEFLDIVIYLLTIILNVYTWSLVYSCILICSICNTVYKVHKGSYYFKNSIVLLYVLLLLINQTDYIPELYLKSLGFLILCLKNRNTSIYG